MHVLAASLNGETVSLYLPASQAMHAVSVAELYFPVAHAVQVVLAVCPVLVPAPHVMHFDSASTPVALEYLPTGHDIQTSLVCSA